jgi:protein-tyrosine phosphatase
MDGASVQPGQNVAIAAVPNLRDLGGWPVPGGRVRSGMLFRSAEFADLEGDDAAALARLDIRSVYDLRTAGERAARPDTLPPGTEYVVLDVLANAGGAGPGRVVKVLSDPKAAEELLGGGRAAGLLEEVYRQLVRFPSALTGYRQFFTDISKPAHRPALIHCTTGKDRTGWAAASFLLLLGVSEEDVRADYLLTNAQLVPTLRPLVDKFASIGGDPDLLTPIIGVRQAYLDAALDEMRTRFATIDGYFAHGLGLDAAAIDQLRAAFIEKA